MIRLDCGCSPTHGQSCPACDGTDAEAGITPPPPDLPDTAQWSAAQLWADDPWLDPHAALTAPF